MQEVTMPIAEVLSKHPFWTKYTPCPWPISLMDGAYFTMLLYRKGAFHSSERYKKNMFPNSQMGAQINLSNNLLQFSVGNRCQVACVCPLFTVVYFADFCRLPMVYQSKCGLLHWPWFWCCNPHRGSFAIDMHPERLNFLPAIL